MKAIPAASSSDRGALTRVLRGSGREFVSTVHGVSMRGTFPAGARVRIRREGASGLVEGQVVVFVRDDTLVAHRFVARGRGVRAARYLVTLGDAGTICDEPVAGDTVLGTVVACEREGEWLPVPAAPARRGWRRAAAPLLLLGVRLALEVDVGMAAALVNLALLGQRWKATVLGEGHPVSPAPRSPAAPASES